MWLDFLIQHHPGFAGIAVDRVALLSLPEDDSVLDQIDTAQVGNDITEALAAGPEGVTDDHYLTTATVPETRAHILEIDNLRAGKLFFSEQGYTLRMRITNHL
jgi:hypothetical protein